MEDIKDLARRAMELTDAQDWAGREALMAPDCEFRVPGAVLRGPAASTAYCTPIVGAFADSRHHLDLVEVAGDRVVVEGRWTATHTGVLRTPAGDVPATGRAVDLPFAAVFHITGGRARSVHIYFDQLAFLTQLGLVPQPQAA